MKLTILFFVILFSLILSDLKAEESYIFRVKILNEKVKVLSPRKPSQSIALILENETVNPIYGKIVKDGENYKFLMLHPRKSVSLDLKFQGKENYEFVSLAPPFQAVSLKFSQKPYEIPPAQSVP